jgi:ankyrin repeat protein
MAATNGHLEVVEYIASQGINIRANGDAVCWAAWYGHLEVIKYLVSQGADIHFNDDYAFRWAVRNNHIDVVKYIVSQGANIHVNDDVIVGPDRSKHPLELEMLQYLKSLYEKT